MEALADAEVGADLLWGLMLRAMVQLKPTLVMLGPLLGRRPWRGVLAPRPLGAIPIVGLTPHAYSTELLEKDPYPRTVPSI